jgi:hypothetical protein
LGHSNAGKVATAEAARLGVPVDELCEAAMPSYGFDNRGERTFALGSHTLTLRLKAANGLDLRIYDESGQLLSSLPKHRKDEDAAAYEQGVADFRALKLQVQQCVRREVKRFESASGYHREYSRSHFESCVLPHPVLGALARCLVWGAFDSEGSELEYFLIDEAGGFLGLGHATVALPENTDHLRPLDGMDLNGRSARRSAYKSSTILMIVLTRVSSRTLRTRLFGTL